MDDLELQPSLLILARGKPLPIPHRPKIVGGLGVAACLGGQNPFSHWVESEADGLAMLLSGDFQPPPTVDHDAGQAGLWQIRLQRNGILDELSAQALFWNDRAPAGPTYVALLPGKILRERIGDGRNYAHVIFMARPWNQPLGGVLSQVLKILEDPNFEPVDTTSGRRALLVSAVGAWPQNTWDLSSSSSAPPRSTWYDGPLAVIQWGDKVRENSFDCLAYVPGGGNAQVVIPGSSLGAKALRGRPDSSHEYRSLQRWLEIEGSWSVQQRCLIAFLADRWHGLQTSPSQENTLSVTMGQDDFHLGAALVLVLLCQGWADGVLHIAIKSRRNREPLEHRGAEQGVDPLWRKFFDHLGAHWRFDPPQGAGSEGTLAEGVPLPWLLPCLEHVDLRALALHCNQRATLIPQPWIAS